MCQSLLIIVGIENVKINNAYCRKAISESLEPV